MQTIFIIAGLVVIIIQLTFLNKKAVQTAFNALKAQVQTVDDLIPDAPAATDQPAA